MRRAGITGYRRHDDRPTYASHLVSGGLSLEIIGRLPGHTQPSTTQRYAHADAGVDAGPAHAAADLIGSAVRAAMEPMER